MNRKTTPSTPLSLAGPAALLAAFAAGALAAGALALPIPPLAAGFALALVALRIWAMVDAVRTPAAPAGPRATAHVAADGALHAAH